MSYLSKVLQPDETVRFVTTLHWIKYMPGAGVLVLALIAWLLARAGYAAGFHDLVALALAIIAAAMVFWAWFDRWTTEIAVTSKRIIYKRGFIRRYTFEANLNKVESVDVYQSIPARIFGYGDLTVKGVGEGGTLLKTIAQPIEFRNHVMNE
jgi:uncharacterized membrane protein YdbT with pleckstrin-like domain